MGTNVYDPPEKKNNKTDSKSALINGICIIIAAIIGVFSININLENNKLDKDIEMLLSENDALKTNIADLEALLSQYGSLKVENDSLKQKITNLELENQELLDKSNILIEESLPSQEEGLNSESKSSNISIRKITEFYSDGLEHRNSSIKDNIGNLYDGYTFMAAGDFWAEPEGSVVFKNNGQYNSLYGRVIIDESEKDAEDCGWVKIYGDETLLFDSGIMGRGIEPIDFDLDIMSYSEIKIVFKDGAWSSKALKYPKCFLVDTYFNKKTP